MAQSISQKVIEGLNPVLAGVAENQVSLLVKVAAFEDQLRALAELLGSGAAPAKKAIKAAAASGSGSKKVAASAASGSASEELPKNSLLFFVRMLCHPELVEKYYDEEGGIRKKYADFISVAQGIVLRSEKPPAEDSEEFWKKVAREIWLKAPDADEMKKEVKKVYEAVKADRLRESEPAALTGDEGLADLPED